jgi:hypothetical protein
LPALRRQAGGLLALAPLAALALLGGGFAGLDSVPTELWGGLPSRCS